MLNLTRKVGEEIVIDGGITLKILSVVGGKVHIGITAPKDTRIMRSELLDRIPRAAPRDESGRPINLIGETL